MTDRRSFFGKLLGGAIAAWLGPKVVKAEPLSLTYPEWRGLRGLTDDGTETGPVFLRGDQRIRFKVEHDLPARQVWAFGRDGRPIWTPPTPENE